jgi:glutamate decarboxylase
VWDFRLPRVVSINTSGHKFGLTYAGCGWVIFRDSQHLPKELIFELHYLGSVEYSFSLNFSRPAHPIIAQYYNFLNLGFEGYRNIALADLKNARLLSRALERSGYYKVLSDIHRPKSSLGGVIEGGKEAIGKMDDNVENYVDGLPVVAFCWTDEFKAKYPHLKQKWMQTLLRAQGMIVPNYELPPEVDNIEILRVVVRESTSEDLVDRIVTVICEVTESLMENGHPGAALHKQVQHPENKQGNYKEEGTETKAYAKPC